MREKPQLEQRQLPGKQRPAGQAFLFIFLVLLIGTILVNGLTAMWTSALTAFNLERDTIITFYLAQSAVERAKIATLSNYWAAGDYEGPQAGNTTQDPDSDHRFEDLDIAVTPNFRYQYNFTVHNPGGTTREITGRGMVVDPNGKVIAYKQIQLTVDGISDTNADTIDDSDADNVVVANTWREP